MTIALYDGILAPGKSRLRFAALRRRAPRLRQTRAADSTIKAPPSSVTHGQEGFNYPSSAQTHYRSLPRQLADLEPSLDVVRAVKLNSSVIFIPTVSVFTHRLDLAATHSHSSSKCPTSSLKNP